MEKQLRILSLVFLFGLISTSVIGQRRGCDVPTVTLVPTVSHATCFNSRGSVSYEIIGYSGAYVNSMKLFDSNGDVVYTQGDNSLSGYIPNLSVGQYRFIGSVVVEYVCDGLTYVTSVPIDLSVWLGIETVWVEKIDMISSPNSYSAKRNALVATYGGVRSSNGIASGNGWIQMNAVHGSSSDNRVFLLVGETNPLGTFDPNSNVQYIEFFKGTGGNGIRIKYKNASGLYVYWALSGNEGDRIRLVRTGTSLTVQLNNSPSNVFTFPQAYSGAMNIAIRTLAENDGCLDVVSSFPCITEDSDIYGHLKYTLDGFYHIMKKGQIKFVFDQEYDADNLTFNIYNQNDILIKTEANFPALATTNGDNYLKIDVSTSGYCIGRGFFYLEVINSKKEKLYMRFFNDYTSQYCSDYINGNESND